MKNAIKVVTTDFFFFFFLNVSGLTLILQDFILHMLNFQKMQETKMRFFQIVTLGKPLDDMEISNVAATTLKLSLFASCCFPNKLKIFKICQKSLFAQIFLFLLLYYHARNWN